MPTFLDALVPSPLHPAVVHLPIALALLAPIFALGALIAIRRGARPVVAWGLATALVAALAVSGWVAIQTGESQEDRVEAVVPSAAMHSHEESAEGFLAVSLVVLGVALAGFLPRRVGGAARIVASLGTFVLVGMGWRVGHSGGELVYRHGAASAYVTTAPEAVVRSKESPENGATAPRRDRR